MLNARIRHPGSRWWVLAPLLFFLNSNPSISAGGIPFVFGSNEDGQTGLGLELGSTLFATRIDSVNLAGKDVIQAATGDATTGGHGLLLTSDGEVFSFGSNSSGATGLGTTVGLTLTPAPIDLTNLGSRRVIQVAAGGQNRSTYSLLLADDGTVFSFGSNELGRTGQGFGVDTTSVATAIDVMNIADKSFTQVSAGGRHSLLLADDGSVFSLGKNEFGATGLATDVGATYIATPIDTTNIGSRRIVEVSAGHTQNSLLLADDGTVFACGLNENGNIGFGAGVSSIIIPTAIDTSNLGGRKIKQISAGSQHGLLLAYDGTVFSFGSGDRGQSGLGFDSDSNFVATPIVDSNFEGKNIVKVAAGGDNSFLLADDGTVYSFGINNGRLGSRQVAAEIDRSNLGGLRVTDIFPGYFHSFLIAVPEPASFVLCLSGILTAWGFTRRR